MIAVGVVVDDAIIDVENIVRRLRQDRASEAPARRRRVVLDASLEVRSAIVYATLIDVVALLPVFLLDGLSGAFFRPLAMSYGLAVLASMLVALTVTPALALILLAARTARRGAAAARAPCCSGPTARSSPGSSARPSRRRRHGRDVVVAGVAVDAAPRRVALPDVQGARLPDALGDASRARRPAGGGADRRAREPASCARSRACATSARTSGRPSWARRSSASTSARTGSASTRRSTTTRPSTRIQDVVDGYPGLYRDVQTYLNERIEEVLTGSSEAIVVRIYGPDLERAAREGRGGRGSAARASRGSTDPHSELLVDVPQIEVEVDLAEGRSGTGSSRVTSAGRPRRSCAGEEVGDIFRTARPTTCIVWSTPEARSSVHRHREPADRHAERRPRPPRRRSPT